MNRLFVYGTLLAPRVQLDLWSEVKTGELAELPGMFVQHTGEFPRLLTAPVPCAPAIGRVLSLTNDELRAASRYEGPDYELTHVRLASGEEVLVYA
jgi:hypothetical protein